MYNLMIYQRPLNLTPSTRTKTIECKNKKPGRNIFSGSHRPYILHFDVARILMILVPNINDFYNVIFKNLLA